MSFVIHRDRNVTPSDVKYFNDTPMLLVRSLFGPTIQGEGPFAGRPAIFVRLGGCNRGFKTTCTFCDTDFAINKSIWLSVDDIAKQVSDLRKEALHVDLVVLTGGEPGLQERPLLPLLVILASLGFTVQIETNGDFGFESIVKASEDLVFPMPVIVCSPKVDMYGIYHIPILYKNDRFSNHRIWRHTYWKFLIECPKEMTLGNGEQVIQDEIGGYRGVPEYIRHRLSDAAANKRVFLSPIAVYKSQPLPGEVASGWSDVLLNRDATMRNYQRAGKLAIEYGYQTSIQQHLFMNLP